VPEESSHFGRRRFCSATGTRTAFWSAVLPNNSFAKLKWVALCLLGAYEWAPLRGNLSCRAKLQPTWRDLISYSLKRNPIWAAPILQRSTDQRIILQRNFA
jgi:hypothetical protein